MYCVCVTLAALCNDVGNVDFTEFISVWSRRPSVFLSADFQFVSHSAADLFVEPVVIPEAPELGAVAAGGDLLGGEVDVCANAAVDKPIEQIAIAMVLSICEGSFVSQRE